MDISDAPTAIEPNAPAGSRMIFLQAGERGVVARLLDERATATVAEARLSQHRARLALESAATKVDEARKKLAEADQHLEQAVDALAKPLTAAYQPRATEMYPAESTGRRLALKVFTAMRAASPDAFGRFQREGRLAASINHPHCVFVFGAEDVDGYPIVWTDVLEPYGTADALNKPLAVFGALSFWWMGEHGKPPRPAPTRNAKSLPPMCHFDPLRASAFSIRAIREIRGCFLPSVFQRTSILT